jgi:hypothetical protein
LQSDASVAEFAETVDRLSNDDETLKEYRVGAQTSAAAFDNHRCAAKISTLYTSLVKTRTDGERHDLSQWDSLLGRVEVEWDLFVEKIHALSATMVETEATEAQLD